MRHFSAIAALLAFLTLGAHSADANTVIGKFNYTAGSDSYSLPLSGYGPGKYRFELDLSTPVNYLDGQAINTITDIQFCFFDGSYQYCGGDDVPGGGYFAGASNLAYIADVTVNPDYEFIDPYTLTKYVHTENCCGFQFDIDAPDAGTATLSVSPAPEPETWALMMVGFGVVGAALRRRSRSTAPARP